MCALTPVGAADGAQEQEEGARGASVDGREDAALYATARVVRPKLAEAKRGVYDSLEMTAAGPVLKIQSA